jgi:hypothetical protein
MTTGRLEDIRIGDYEAVTRTITAGDLAKFADWMLTGHERIVPTKLQLFTACSRPH